MAAEAAQYPAAFAAARAYEQGANYERGGVRVGPGWRGGSRVGYRGRPAVPMNPAAANRRASVSGTPPPEFYNPQKQWEREVGTARLGRAEDEGARTRQRLQDDYYRSLGQIQQREGYRRTDAAKTLEAVKRNFGILGTRQEEQANRAGVLQGGALIQAAAKRAGNQEQSEGAQKTALDRGLTSDREAREALALQQGPPALQGLDWAHLIGSGAGRRVEDLAQHIKGLREEDVALGKQTEEGENREAREAGWKPLAAPKAPARPRAAAPRVVGGHRQGPSRARARRR